MNSAINHIHPIPFSAHRIQTAGLGGMKPNTIILGWPNSWRKKEEDSWRVFVDSIRYASAAHMALLVPKGIQESCHGRRAVQGPHPNPISAFLPRHTKF